MQAPAPIQVAAPLNDVQLVAMVAAEVKGSLLNYGGGVPVFKSATPIDPVAVAVKIVAKSVVAVMFNKSLEKEVQRLLDEQRAEQQQQQQQPEHPDQSPDNSSDTAEG